MALDKKDPKRKLERRVEKRAKRSAESSTGKSRPDEPAAFVEDRATSRYIPSEVRERVHARAGYQCEYYGQDGTRCRSRTALQIEHERPFAIYHCHDERFLKLFCPPHNRVSAERVYGGAFIEDKIHASRQRSTPNSHGIHRSQRPRVSLKA